MDQRADGPDFLCIGAQKAGTHWLYDQLAAHPWCWMPPIKELHFFDGQFRRERAAEMLSGQRRWRRPSPGDLHGDRDRTFLLRASSFGGESDDFDWYAKLFAAKDGYLSGDVTPAYSTLKRDCAAKIAARFPGLRILFLVRNPIDRVWSQYCMVLRRNAAIPTAEPSDWKSVETFLKHPEVESRSHPSWTYREWRAAFAAEQFFVGFFDDLVARPQVLRANILDFLDLDASLGMASIDPYFNRKSKLPKIPLPPLIAKKLHCHFLPELEAAAELFGGPAATWLDRPA